MRNAQITLGAAGLLVAGSAFGQSVQVGDLSFGLSSPNNEATHEIVRDAALLYNLTAFDFVQSTEFDNLIEPFGHGGNLLALNFGASDTGGELYNFATNGDDAGEVLFSFDGTFNVNTSRLAGLSVSPDNTRVAFMGFDNGSLYVADYSADDGDGSGGAITDVTEYEFITAAGFTQGTTWQDNDTVLMGSLRSGFDLEIIAIDANDGSVSTVGSVDLADRFKLASTFTDIEHNPDVDPNLIYINFSSFDGASQTTLVATDTAGAEVNSVTLDGSAGTGREIALDGNGLLFLSQFGAEIDTISDNPADWVDDGSTDYYVSDEFSSFNGIDVALTADDAPADFTLSVEGPCPGQNTITVSNGTAGGNVAVIYAFGTGNLVIPDGNPCAGTTLGLNNSATLGLTFGLDGSGNGTQTVNVPGAACGNIFIQALDLTTCDTSNVEAR